MIKSAITIFFLFSYSLIYAINPKHFDCILLQKSINTKEFKEHFFICKNSNENLEIIDKSKYFDNCNLLDICERHVVISHILPDNITPDRTLGFDGKNKIILYKVEKKKNKYKLFFWSPSDNGGLVLELTKCNKEINIKVISRGVF